MKRKRSRYKWLICGSVSVAGVVILKTFVWDSENYRWLIQDLYSRPPLTAKLTLAPKITPVSTSALDLKPTLITDASKLDPTWVAGVFQPTSVPAIRELIAVAQKMGKKISISGARHTMGGQIVAWFKRGCQYFSSIIRSTDLNRVALSTIQPGYLRRDLAIRK